MKPYSYKISLRVEHPSVEPAEISAALDLTPKRFWKAGEPRATPVGTPLNGVRREAYWVADVFEGACPGKTLAEALGELANRFAIHTDFFGRIQSEGGKAEFFVGWFIDGNRGDELSATLLGQLSKLGINLSLDIYPPPNSLDEF